MTRKLTFALALFMLGTLPIFAQRQADWSAELSGKAQQIIFQNMTGVPIIQTEQAYIGIDPVSQKIAWSIDRAGDKAFAAVIEVSFTDFFNMEFTPYVLIRNNLVDSRTGQLILEKGKDDYKRVEDYEIIPSLNSVLLRTTADGKLRLFLVNMADNKMVWKVDVTKLGLMSNFKQDDGTETVERIDIPVQTTIVTADKKHIVYRYKKTVASMEVATGKLLWSEKLNPAELLLSPDEKMVLVIEGESGGLIGAATATSDVKMKSNKLLAYDLSTGKEAWKKEIKADERIRWVDPHPDFLTIVHKKGCNLYDYTTGEPFWKKDFEGRRVIEILPNAEGYLVTYHSGYKSMQVDKTGKSLWKKPQVQEFDDGEVEVPEDEGFDRYHYTKGDVLVDAGSIRFAPAKGSGLKGWRTAFGPGARLTFDEERNNLVVLNNKKLVIINPDRYETTGIQYKFGFESTSDFHTLEIRGANYFITSNQEYAIVNPDDNTAFHKYYKRPVDSKGILMGIASAGLAIGATALAVSSVNNAGKGSSKEFAATLGMLPPGSGSTELRKSDQQLKAANVMGDASSFIPPARFNAFQQTRDHAYYFTAEKSGDDALKMLIKLNKDTGVEADKLIFDDPRPIYQIDEIQRRVYYANKSVIKVFNL